MIDPHCSVLRDNCRHSIAADHVVPGDIVFLDAGDRVPADLRLLSSHALHMDEAALTGESLPVEKHTGSLAQSTALADRSNMAYTGSYVASGQGMGVVVATAQNTQLGQIGTMLQKVEVPKTPLIIQMDQFARTLALLTLSVAAIAFLYTTLIGTTPVADAFMAVIGLAVSAIPEGLPAVLSITLALGVQRMAKRHAIIRRLPAVETLGAVSVICTDKTGTLTRNEMTVSALALSDAAYDVTGAGYEPEGAILQDGQTIDPAGHPGLPALLEVAALCNDARIRKSGSTHVAEGDPMEAALITLAMKAGQDLAQIRHQFPRRTALPFDARHRFMATLHPDAQGQCFAAIKGAPEKLLAICTKERNAQGEDRPIDLAGWHKKIGQLAAQGQRVLAFAVKSFPADKQEISVQDFETDAVFLGCMGFIDPPRKEVASAIKDCHTASIHVVMITGDHAATATEIARQIGLSNTPETITGAELDRMDDPALAAAITKTDVFARTTPEHKLRLVEAFQKQKRVLAMTGDGVNDAPALKRADVGVAMGKKGTEAAKQAADMVLADDNFSSIVAAVREGRTVYDNLMKVIGWTLPTSIGEAMTILIALFFGLALPVTPVQILWINMITAVALGTTLAFEPTEPGTMSRPPRKSGRPILDGALIWQVLFLSVLFLAGAFGVFYKAQANGLPIEAARTIVVNTLVVMEIFYLFSVRYIHGSSITLRGVIGTKAVLIGVALVAVGQLAFTYLPAMQAVFDTRPISLVDGAIILLIGIALIVIVEMEKKIRRTFFARKTGKI